MATTYNGFEKIPLFDLSSGRTTILESPETAGAPQSGHLGQAAQAGQLQAGQATVTGAAAPVKAGLASVVDMVSIGLLSKGLLLLQIQKKFC